MATTNLVSLLSRRLTLTSPKLKQKSVSHYLNSTSTSRIPITSRVPVELVSAVETMKPLHSVIASARLLSSLSIDSQGWCLVPQGVSMPL